MLVGRNVGAEEGTPLGDVVGELVRPRLGDDVGLEDGLIVGADDGNCEFGLGV